MDVKGKRILVVGIARSGIACVQLLSRAGAKVVASDLKSETELSDALEQLKPYDVEYHLGCAPDALIETVDAVVFSPGAPPDSPFLQKAKRLGIEAVGELELAYRFSQADIVAITGTNGKTTTTTLTSQIFADAGYTSYALGNIGVPMASVALDTKPGDVIAAEVSAHQLETIIDFHPRVASILNLTEDHLNWFGTLERYFEAKAHIFKNQNDRDYAVLNYDDPEVRAMRERTPAKVLFFSHHPLDKELGAWQEDGSVYYDIGQGKKRLCATDAVYIPGNHNLENAMAAALMALCLGVSPQSIRHTLMTFKGVEHRIETVRELDGVEYINDSKGTNTDATIKAIEAMKKPTILVAGGSDKQTDFTTMVLKFGDRIKGVVVLGQTAKQIADTCKEQGFAAVSHAKDMEDAVRIARAQAKPGDAVLLSPACASFDMFTDFEHRGRVFKEIVNKLS